MNKQGFGYTVDKQHSIGHLLYMGNLKLFIKDEYQLEQALVNIKVFSDDIKMEFCLDKCATAVFKGGKLVKRGNIQLDHKRMFQSLDQKDVYKYLGDDESDGIHHGKMKEKMTNEY